MTTAPDRILDDVPTKLFIAGAWVDSGNSRTLPVYNPATDERFAQVADATTADALQALTAATAAAPGWEAVPARARADILATAFHLLHRHRDDLAQLITLEAGKPLVDARSEVEYAADYFRWFAEEAVRLTGRITPNSRGAGTTIVTRRPVGPVYLITPWNFPLAMAARKIAPALAAGCTIVHKPAELTPLTAHYLAVLLTRAGVPAGVLNVVTTTAAAAQSQALMADPRLRKVSFTGSTPVGRVLLAQAGANVLHTSMELGGNNPFLVFEDADLEYTVEAAMHAKFRNHGQACTAANRFLVHESVIDEFTTRVVDRVAALRVGDGSDPTADIGPLIDHRAATRVDALVNDAIDDGAILLTGGNRPAGPGSFYTPTVLASVPASARIVREEIFGPVLTIATFANDDEAVHLANDTEYGLAGYAFTRDLDRAQHLLGALKVGMLGINSARISHAEAPFGGVHQSGLGREGGAEGILEYTDTHYALLR